MQQCTRCFFGAVCEVVWPPVVPHRGGCVAWSERCDRALSTTTTSSASSLSSVFTIKHYNCCWRCCHRIRRPPSSHYLIWLLIILRTITLSFGQNFPFLKLMAFSFIFSKLKTPETLSGFESSIETIDYQKDNNNTCYLGQCITGAFSKTVTPVISSTITTIAITISVTALWWWWAVSGVGVLTNGASPPPTSAWARTAQPCSAFQCLWPLCLALHISNEPALCSELRLWSIFATPQNPYCCMLCAHCPLLCEMCYDCFVHSMLVLFSVVHSCKHIPQQTVGTLLPPGWSALPTRECQTSIYPLSRTMLYFLFICPFICLYRSLAKYCGLCVNCTNKYVALLSALRNSRSAQMFKIQQKTLPQAQLMPHYLYRYCLLGSA